MMRRVVVTGLGAVTPLGVGAKHSWRRLLQGESGLRSVAELEPRAQWRDLTSTVAGLVPTTDVGDSTQWDASRWLSQPDQRRMSKFTQYAVAAADMAIEDAGGLSAVCRDPTMTGVCLGSGIGNLDEIYETSLAFSKDVSTNKRQPLPAR